MIPLSTHAACFYAYKFPICAGYPGGLVGDLETMPSSGEPPWGAHANVDYTIDEGKGTVQAFSRHEARQALQNEDGVLETLWKK